MRRKQAFTLIIFLAAALVVAFAPVPVLEQPTERVIRVEAADYAFTPSVIHANPGDQITIELISKDVVHGLSIDGYPAVDLQAEPGRPARITFVAEKSGTFKLRCAIACGNLHPFMTGKIEVGPNQLLYRAGGLALLITAFGAWKAAQKNQVNQ
jgi:cytochrome c oxidase subunit 2